MITEAKMSLAMRLAWLNKVESGYWMLLATYSLLIFSSPMPPKITVIEILMGGGLTLSSLMLIGKVWEGVKQYNNAPWIIGCMSYLILIPFIWGLTRGNASQEIIRDIFPLLFLLVVPVFLIYSVTASNRKANVRAITTVLLVVGIGTAITFFMGISDMFGSSNAMLHQHKQRIVDIAQNMGPVKPEAVKPEAVKPEETEDQGAEIKRRIIFLKPYDPALLFTSIFLTSWGMVWLIRSWFTALFGCVMISAGLFISYSFMIIGQRACAGLFLSAVIFVCLTQIRERGIYVRVLPIVLGLIFAFWSHIVPVFELLWMKQLALGGNGKSAEGLAVISTIFATPQFTLVGLGWGGVLDNPIFGATTRFTHSVVTYFLLKTGFVGLSALVATVILLLTSYRRFGCVKPIELDRFILMISCLPPLMIGVFFQPTYKMLSYGVILALFILTLPSFKKE